MKLNYFSNNNIKIVKVEAGCRHTLFLDSKGKVYGYGLTKKKNHNTERLYSPEELENLSDLTEGNGCIDIFAGDTQSVAIGADGLPYRWDGVTGKYEIIEEVGGKYILECVVGNQNIIILA